MPDTLLNNLCLYRPHELKEVLQLLRAVKLDRLAEEKYLAGAIRKGENFSGGEEKRLALVRTLLANKAIVILDEPFANTDKESREKILELILTLQDKFVIVITHEFPAGLREAARKEICF